MNDQENDQSKQSTKQDQPKTDDQQKNISISPDKWNEMQSNFKHMSNTVHNLSTKLENAHKSDDTPKSSKHVDSSHDNHNYVSRDDFDRLAKGYKQLSDKMTKRNNHADVLQHAKSALKMNNMKVSPSTFNHLLGSDNQATDANIGWFKKIYKQVNSKPKMFPRQTQHKTNKTTIGAQIAKDDKNHSSMRPLDDCFKN